MVTCVCGFLVGFVVGVLVLADVSKEKGGMSKKPRPSSPQSRPEAARELLFWLWTRPPFPETACGASFELPAPAAVVSRVVGHVVQSCSDKGGVV